MSELNEIYTKKKFNMIEKKYNIFFEDKSLLVKAFIHSSYSSKTNHNYQRLEFLGDSILDMILADYLYRQNQENTEGDLSKQRSALVNERSLAFVVRQEGLIDYIVVGKSMIGDNVIDFDSFTSDVYESFVASIYLDKGYKKAEEFVKKTLFTYWDDIINLEDNIDFKTKLQELLQVNGAIEITYETHKHNNEFRAKVILDGLVIGRGKGRTKKKAEQLAAKDALNKGDM
ncbi:MAG: ribonuclease III [Mycoplasmatales bacterium]